MTLTQIIIGLTIIIILAIGLIISISNVIFQYKKRKVENEMYLRVKRRREDEKQKDIIDKLSK